MGRFAIFVLLLRWCGTIFRSNRRAHMRFAEAAAEISNADRQKIAEILDGMDQARLQERYESRRTGIRSGFVLTLVGVICGAFAYYLYDSNVRYPDRPTKNTGSVGLLGEDGVFVQNGNNPSELNASQVTLRYSVGPSPARMGLLEEDVNAGSNSELQDIVLGRDALSESLGPNPEIQVSIDLRYPPSLQGKRVAIELTGSARLMPGSGRTNSSSAGADKVVVSGLIEGNFPVSGEPFQVWYFELPGVPSVQPVGSFSASLTGDVVDPFGSLRGRTANLLLPLIGRQYDSRDEVDAEKAVLEAERAANPGKSVNPYPSMMICECDNWWYYTPIEGLEFADHASYFVTVAGLSKGAALIDSSFSMTQSQDFYGWTWSDERHAISAAWRSSDSQDWQNLILLVCGASASLAGAALLAAIQAIVGIPKRDETVSVTARRGDVANT